ncbi:hypothetical protein PGT21_031635 [Puccinia graminis f. sp. tritici]|uniref:Uncharacterized protein n=1 Tax=Puccinia graminis f. sp. tritici TaxID=56615 RepID=A0A5B0Q478_PUCGR|nr:hypothetical protein PGT21_031635 [Puccinia graminis f. sp. tritici]KAA1107938.1 hypothetical protein PGTUg99_013665 [Puccinia graminis f. sp. tritici]
MPVNVSWQYSQSFPEENTNSMSDYHVGAFENQGLYLYQTLESRNGTGTFLGPSRPPPHPTVAAHCRRARRERRRNKRTPPSGVGTPPRPRDGARGVLARRARDVAADAEEQARPTSTIRLA